MKEYTVLINVEKKDLFISERDSSDLKRLYTKKGYYIESSYNKDRILKRRNELRKFI